MAAIRGRDTVPELALRSALHSRGYRFRVDARDLPGRPDLKLTSRRAVVFVHGCFWHGHDCPKFRPPLSNVEFWLSKIERNRARDRRVAAELLGSGWRVAVVWECAILGHGGHGASADLVEALSRWLDGRRRFVEFGGRALDSGKSARRASYLRNDSPAVFAAEREAAYRGLGAATRRPLG